MSQTSGTVQSLERALDIVEFLYSHGGKAALQEIASGLGLHKSTVHRLLATLKQRDYVYQDSGDLRYGLGLRFFWDFDFWKRDCEQWFFCANNYTCCGNV